MKSISKGTKEALYWVAAGFSVRTLTDLIPMSETITLFIQMNVVVLMLLTMFGTKEKQSPVRAYAELYVDRTGQTFVVLRKGETIIPPDLLESFDQQEKER